MTFTRNQFAGVKNPLSSPILALQHKPHPQLLSQIFTKPIFDARYLCNMGICKPHLFQSPNPFIPSIGQVSDRPHHPTRVSENEESRIQAGFSCHWDKDHFCPCRKSLLLCYLSVQRNNNLETLNLTKLHPPGHSMKMSTTVAAINKML